MGARLFGTVPAEWPGGLPTGYVRIFADESAPMHALLGRLLATRPDQQPAAGRIDPGYLAALVRACDPADATPRRRFAAAPPGLAEPLTDRESEVLRLLAAGRSDQRIAHDLVVALHTVKKHVTHILGKLGAANRTEAVARARPGHDPLTHRTSAGPVAPSGKGIVAPRHSTRQAPSSDVSRRP